MAVEVKKRKLSAESDDLGKVDSLRYRVLNYVSGENYQKGIDLLIEAIDSHPEYPKFKPKSQRYLNYGVDLINGIKAKRSFPGMSNLPANKQEELFDRAAEHFDDLKVTLKRVERIELEVRIEDKRASIWIVKAFIYCSIAVASLGCFLEIQRGAMSSAMILIDDAFTKATNYIFK